MGRLKGTILSDSTRKKMKDSNTTRIRVRCNETGECFDSIKTASIKMVGLIIGRNGETVKTIHQLTGCLIFIPKESRPGDDFRELQLSGPPESVEICKKEIIC